MAWIYINTLGSLRIVRDGEEIHDLPTQPVRCALLLYLAVKRTASRDELTAIIWPERNTDRARHSLSQTLYELRRQLGENCFRLQSDHVEISPEIVTDTLEFKEKSESGLIEQAFELYNGPFLHGYHFGVSKEFEEWADRYRFEMERHYRDVCRTLSNKYIDAGDDKAALEVARKWVDTDPLEDEAQHLFIELLASSGHRAEAIQQYNIYSELISRELGIEPLDETKLLIKKIREENTDHSITLNNDNDTNHNYDTQDDRFRDTAPDVLNQSVQDNTHSKHFYIWMVLALLFTISAGFFFYFSNQPPDTSLTHLPESSIEPEGIAVLPFVNMSPDPEQEYFADGITEDLLTSLTKLRRMRVISRTSVMRYKNSDKSLPEIAGELNVEYVLEGSVRRDQNQIRITAQLIEVANDNHLWAETYDREFTDIFNIKSDIAYQISEALQEQLQLSGHDRAVHSGTDNITAYDLFLRGREYLNRPGDADQRKYIVATELFQQAFEADPEFTRAYSSLSEVFRRNVLLPVPIRRDSMLYYSAKAVELDGESAEAATEMGFAYLFAWEHTLAETEFQRALSMDPNQTDAMSGLARLSVLNGQLDEAVRWLRTGLQSDPLSTEILFNLGQYLFDLGDIHYAQMKFQRIVTLVPDHPEASYMLALTHLLLDETELAESRMKTLELTASDPMTVYVMMAMYEAFMGRYEQAEHYLTQTPASEFGATRVFYAFIADRTGDQNFALELLNQPVQMLSEWKNLGYSIPSRGKFYISLIQGDLESAISIFEQNWQNGLHWLEDPPDIGFYWIDRHPITEPLHDDPRFHQIITRMRATFDDKRESL
jgi:TolB-like protein/DNA-binding SARP family transcriptional activator/Tfp pilus assembly protein PilF